MAAGETNDDDQVDGADFGRLVGGVWSLEDVIRPVGERRQAHKIEDLPEGNNWERASKAGARSIAKLRRIDGGPGPVEKAVLPIVKAAVVQGAIRGVIPRKMAGKIVGSRKMKGA